MWFWLAVIAVAVWWFVRCGAQKSSSVKDAGSVTERRHQSKPHMRIAPVIDDPLQRGIDQEYRRSDDPSNVIRLNQYPPEGFVAKLREYIPVAGITRPEHLHNAEALIAGRNRRVEVERAPFEGHPEAMRVFGIWSDENGEHRAQVGWIPADIARQIMAEYPEGPIGATIEAMFLPQSDKSIGIRIDLWRPRRRLRAANAGAQPVKVSPDILREIRRQMKSLQKTANPVDRHFIYLNAVIALYKHRNDPEVLKLFEQVARQHIEEFPLLLNPLAKFLGGPPPVLTYQYLATTLAEQGKFDEAIEVCEQAIKLGLHDGTKGDYQGRIERIRRQQAKTGSG